MGWKVLEIEKPVVRGYYIVTVYSPRVETMGFFKSVPEKYEVKVMFWECKEYFWHSDEKSITYTKRWDFVDEHGMVDEKVIAWMDFPTAYIKDRPS